MNDSVSGLAGAFWASHGEKLKLNQYWYSVGTIRAIVDEIQEHATRVAFLSTPSLFFSLTNKHLADNSKLFDYDEMWASHPCFVKYDYKLVQDIPCIYHGAFDYVVIDPPFVTDVVWDLYARAAKLLLCDGFQEITVPSTALSNHSDQDDVVDSTFLNSAAPAPSSRSPGYLYDTATDTTINDKTDDGFVRIRVPKGKILLTTIPEHVDFLYEKLGVSIRRFRPSIPNLIYQYSLYTNYPSQRLNQLNPEIDNQDDQHDATASKTSTRSSSSSSSSSSAVSPFAYRSNERPIQPSKYGGFSSESLEHEIQVVEATNPYIPSGKAKAPRVIHSSRKKITGISSSNTSSDSPQSNQAAS